jgi:hypothetical protein
MHTGKQPSQGKACERQQVECSAPYRMKVEPRAVITRLLLEQIALQGMCRAGGVGLEG